MFTEKLESIPEEGLEILKSLTTFLDDQEQAKAELAHITKVFSVPEIRNMYLSGNYNAELLVQHCLLHLDERN
jgi:hypothetical protein